MNIQKVGDNYVRTLGNSLRFSHHIESIELSYNWLNGNGASCILKSFNDSRDFLPKIKEMDFSKNKIYDSDITELVNYINVSKYNLEIFNVYGNFLGDENIKLISDAFCKFASFNSFIVFLVWIILVIVVLIQF